MTIFRAVPLLLLLPGVALAFANEPEGFGAARFGMSQEQVKHIFPQMKPASAGSVENLPLAFYDLDKQTVHGIGPCKLQLRFAGDQLYEITFDCGRDDKVEQMLREHYGPPAQHGPKGAYWYGDKGGITMNPRARTFAFVDMERNKTVQGALLAAAIKGNQPGPGQAAPALEPGTPR